MSYKKSSVAARKTFSKSWMPFTASIHGSTSCLWTPSSWFKPVLFPDVQPADPADACRNGYLASTLAVVQEWHADGQTELPSATSRPKANGGCAAPRDPQENEHPQPVIRLPEKGAARADFGAVREVEKEFQPARTAAWLPRAAFAGDPSRIAAAVLEEVRVVARERANGLTLDTSILGIGLDSLERMEILSGIEERFGGRFPENIYPELETCRDVVAAVENYLGSEPRAKTLRTADADIPARITASGGSRNICNWASG